METKTTTRKPTLQHYRFGINPNEVPLEEGDWSEENILLAGFSPEDPEVNCCQLSRDWGGWPKGAQVICALTELDSEFVIIQ